MSQNWHAHWMEENYKPKRLGNWQIPKWYPQFPDRHCRITTFQCDNKGHLLAHLKKTNHERENFKTTWELPKKITKFVAQELSTPSKYRMQLWKEHKAFNRATCENGKKSEKNLTNNNKNKKSSNSEERRRRKF
ncbi:protein Flattop [Leptopilina boulardi]|uniref:protein Flattop n=1 Tax=Leptopilina boulardi TaxID=63433 RepID=UPI0021F63600|nr:protein Flattop [Leptopilina boulardi]